MEESFRKFLQSNTRRFEFEPKQEGNFVISSKTKNISVHLKVLVTVSEILNLHRKIVKTGENYFTKPQKKKISNVIIKITLMKR